MAGTIFLAKAFKALTLPVLSSRFEQADFTFVDIGGRGSVVRDLRMLAQFAHYVTCEPDRVEAERLVDENRAYWKHFTAVPAAIASSTGQATMYIAKKDGMSSLLEPDQAVVNQFSRSRRFEIVQTSRVATITLDEAAATYGFADACFLKLDTQGTELDILRSGPTTLTSVLGINVEAAFRPFYRGQALFGDVDAALRCLGFDLFLLNRTNVRHSPGQEDLVSRRVTTYAHALYFRNGAGLNLLGRTRLLGLLLAFAYFDLALSLADHDEAPEVRQLAEMATSQVRRHGNFEGFASKVTRDRDFDL